MTTMPEAPMPPVEKEPTVTKAPPGGKLFLVGAQPAVRSLLAVTRLDKVFPLFIRKGD